MTTLRPWETKMGQRPWEASEIIYARTIAVHRPNPTPKKGQIGYQGQTNADESVVVSGLPASIQRTREGRSIKADLPADVTRRGEWNVFLRAQDSILGQIVRGDIVVDDLGNRYQVMEPYWNVLGYRLFVEQVLV